MQGKKKQGTITWLENARKEIARNGGGKCKEGKCKERKCKERKCKER